MGNMATQPRNRDRVKRSISFSIVPVNNTYAADGYWTILSLKENDEEKEFFLVVPFKLIHKGDAERMITGTIENVPSNHTADQFQQHFRIPLETFEELLRLIAHQIEDDKKPDCELIDPRKQLLSVIWLLVTPDPYSSIGARFKMALSTLNASFVRVVRALCNIAPRIIRWPEQAEMEAIKQKFQRLSNIPGVIGAIDASYIPIRDPKVDPEVYINRKSFDGITLQAICTSSLKYIDCSFGYPSSVSDVRILRKSVIYALIRANPQNYFPNGEFLLGDKADPVLSWLIPPYINRGNTTEIQKDFNKTLASTRQVVERSFALLKGRFRRLQYLDMERTTVIPTTILASCVLHNICIDCDDLYIEEYINEGLSYSDQNEEQPMNPEHRAMPGENDGHQKRNELAESLYDRV